MLYARIIDGRVAVLQSAASYEATHGSVKGLWEVVPDGTAVGANRNTNGSFTPPPSGQASGPRLLAIGLFLVRIPFPKLAAIKAAEPTDPGIAAMMEVVRSLKEIDLHDVHTSEMLGYLVSKNLIDAGDMAAVLS